MARSREGAERAMSGHEGGKKRPLKQAKKQANEMDYIRNSSKSKKRNRRNSRRKKPLATGGINNLAKKYTISSAWAIMILNSIPV